MKTGKDLLREIESWPIEAKDDDTGRYFFEIAELQAILEGKKNYVIGRKGTGKTSIAEHLRNYQQTNYFAEKLTFKNFPFNILYELRDSSYTSPNQYITIWKYVIYSAVCKMMSANESLPSEVRKTLKSVFPDDIETALQVHIKKFTDRSFSLGAYGFNVGIGGTAASQFESEWTNRVSILESFISSKIDTSHYMVVFDELDEDYKDIFGDTKRSASYFDLLTSLFKACQDIRNVSKKARANIVPVIFLRSDVYELLRDPDKNKWRDRAVDLTWTKHSLRNLFAYRVSRAMDAAGQILSADQAWSAISNVSTMRYGSRSDRKEDGFSYLLRSTFLRPRDVVSYVRECAKAALTSGKIRIDVPTIKAAELAHSAFARREVIDEVHSALSDIDEILDIFSDIRKSIFPIQEFKVHYERYLRSKPSERSDGLTFDKILEVLFHFSVIGNITTGQHQIFRYNSDRARFNFSEQICIHRSLLKNFEIY